MSRDRRRLGQPLTARPFGLDPWLEERRPRVQLFELIAAVLLLPFTLTFASVFAQILGF